MNNQEIVNYVMNTPSNTNRAILNQMLDDRDVSWNDLKDKPFYEEIKTYPHTVLFDGELPEYGDWYMVKVDSSGFVGGDTIEITYSGSIGGDDDVTVTGIAEDRGDHGIEVHFNNPDDSGMMLHYNDGRLQISSNYYTHAVVKLLKPREEVVIHPVEPKYLPNSVWTEKQSRVILENQTVKGAFHLTTDTFFAEGETVTVVWDGVTYERVAQDSERPWVGETAYLFDIDVSGEPFAIQCHPAENSIVVYPCNDGRLETENTHTVSIYVHEEVVKTNCDLMVILKQNSDTGGGDAKLVSGDFATVKAKILKGLPATAYVCFTSYEDEWQQTINYVDPICYVQDLEDEYCYGYNASYTMLSDNTITYD